MASAGSVLLGLTILGGLAALALTSGGSTGASKGGRQGVGGTLPGNGSPANSRGRCPTAGAPPAVHTATMSLNGTTLPIRVADSLQTWLYISQADYDWKVTSSDPSVLYSDRHTSGPDATDPNGSDTVDYWATQGKTGTVTLTGQLLPKKPYVGMQPIATFALTVQVVC